MTEARDEYVLETDDSAVNTTTVRQVLFMEDRTLQLGENSRAVVPCLIVQDVTLDGDVYRERVFQLIERGPDGPLEWPSV